MADKSDVVLEEDTVRVLSAGESPVLDVQGGNHWNLSESDGDVRIGDDEYMLKMGVATGGGGAGNARIWATSDLKLGSEGTSVVSIDDRGLHPHDGNYSLGTSQNRWRNAFISQIGTTEVWGNEGLKLGNADELVVSIDDEGNGDGAVRPRGGDYSLGTSGDRWWNTHFDRTNTNVLNVEEEVISHLVPPQDGGEFSLPTPNLGSDDSRWSTLYVDEVDAESVNTPSDRRLKTDIEDLEGGLDAVLDLRPVSYTWREDGDETHLGLIGQEVADVLPEMVTVPEDDGHLKLDYTELVAVLVDAVQDQHAENEALADRIDDQRERIESQQDRIDDLEERLAALEEAA